MKEYKRLKFRIILKGNKDIITLSGGENGDMWGAYPTDWE